MYIANGIPNKISQFSLCSYIERNHACMQSTCGLTKIAIKESNNTILLCERLYKWQLLLFHSLPRLLSHLAKLVDLLLYTLLVCAYYYSEVTKTASVATQELYYWGKPTCSCLLSWNTCMIKVKRSKQGKYLML